MKVVIDTNTLVPAAIEKVPPSVIGQIINAWLEKRAFDLLVSEHIIEEVRDALKDKYYADRLQSYQVGQFVGLLRNHGRMVVVKTRIEGVATHREDDEIIATAIDGGAQYIVTRDVGFLSVEAYQGIQIIDPYQFFHLIRRSL